jgi:hypothetical protein
MLVVSLSIFSIFLVDFRAIFSHDFTKYKSDSILFHEASITLAFIVFQTALGSIIKKFIAIAKTRLHTIICMFDLFFCFLYFHKKSFIFLFLKDIFIYYSLNYIICKIFLIFLFL